jgi:ferredoxin
MKEQQHEAPTKEAQHEAPKTGEPKHDRPVMRFGMVIDLDKCTGCGACMVACMSENNVPFKEDESDKLTSIAWMRVFKLTNGKPFPDTDICYLPRPCQHCEGHTATPLVCRSARQPHRLQHRNRYRQPDLHPLLRLPVLHGCLPLPRPLFQLVGPGLARRHGKIPEPQRFATHARCCRKVQLLFPPLPAGQDKAYLRRGPDRRRTSIRRPAPRPVRPAPSFSVTSTIRSTKSTDRAAGYPQRQQVKKSQGHSGCWSGWAPTPRFTICPIGNGSGERETTTWPMRRGQVSKPHH